MLSKGHNARLFARGSVLRRGVSVSAMAWDIIGRLNAIEINTMPAPPAVAPPVAVGGINQITITG